METSKNKFADKKVEKKVLKLQEEFNKILKDSLLIKKIKAKK